MDQTEMLYDVSPGWWAITEMLHAELLFLDPDYEILQVKEKFGGLRYYYTPSNVDDKDTSDLMDISVRAAEHECDITCEMCGSPGELRSKNRYWMKTLCNSCDDANAKNKRKQ